MSLAPQLPEVGTILGAHVAESSKGSSGGLGLFLKVILWCAVTVLNERPHHVIESSLDWSVLASHSSERPSRQAHWWVLLTYVPQERAVPCYFMQCGPLPMDSPCSYHSCGCTRGTSYPKHKLAVDWQHKHSGLHCIQPAVLAVKSLKNSHISWSWLAHTCTKRCLGIRMPTHHHIRV